MKKLILSIITLFITTSMYANSVEKTGFLTTKWCADRGLLADCRMETIFCGYENCYKDEKKFTTDVNATFVLNIHDEGKYYTVKFKEGVELGEILEKAINKNEVTLIGELHGNEIEVHEFKAPPPPKKSFFKGCL